MKVLIFLLTFILCTLNAASVMGQKKDTLKNSSSKKYESRNSDIGSLKSVEKAILDSDEEEQATQYIRLADQLSLEARYEEANTYLEAHTTTTNRGKINPGSLKYKERLAPTMKN